MLNLLKGDQVGPKEKIRNQYLHEAISQTCYEYSSSVTRHAKAFEKYDAYGKKKAIAFTRT